MAGRPFGPMTEPLPPHPLLKPAVSPRDAPGGHYAGWMLAAFRSSLSMVPDPSAFVLDHRERLAVLLSSALFLAGALPLFWAIG